MIAPLVATVAVAVFVKLKLAGAFTVVPTLAQFALLQLASATGGEVEPVASTDA